jgi:AraC-like DNA-binding protein
MTVGRTVFCLVPDEVWLFVPRIAIAAESVRRVHAVSSLCQLLRASSNAVALFDPSLVRADHLRTLEAVLAESDACTIALVQPPLSPFASTVLSIASTVPTEIVLARSPFDGAELRRHLLSSSPSATARLLQRMSGNFDRLPIRTLPGVLGLFGGLPIPHSVSSLSDTIGLSRRSLERQLHDAEIRGAKPLLDAARLTASWPVLGDQTGSIEHSAELSQFSSPRALNDRCASLTGYPPRRAARMLTVDQLVSKLALRLLAQPSNGAITPCMSQNSIACSQ